MLVVTENYNLLEANIMKWPFFKDNAKNIAMQVYNGRTVKIGNKLFREVHHKNVAIIAENNNVAIPEASSEQIEPSNPASEVPKPRDRIYELCNNRKDKLLPFLNNNTMLFEKMARSFAWEINVNDNLKCCSHRSMVNAFYKCCEYGLDPASSLGHAWLVPYKGNIDLQIGYRGWLKLLFNSPLVSNVYSYPVYEDDEFSYELGMNPNIKHIPCDCSPP